jgi:hypothetical protein
MLGKLTIVYNDGREEKYSVTLPDKVNAGTQKMHLQQLVENDLLKLMVNGEQFVLIPIGSIKKILINFEREFSKVSDLFTGILYVTPVEE